MSKGFDSARDLTSFAASLAQSYDFVVRYYNVNNQTKNLSLAEANIISGTGLKIAVVWENGFPTDASYFNYQKGVDDGTAAYYYAQNTVRQPGMTPIYFAVDFDAAAADATGGITEYFKGVRDGFNTISGNNPIYLPGVYGSGLVCSTIISAGLAVYSWLAMSSRWRGSKTYASYNIKQLKTVTEAVNIGTGVSGDTDESPNNNEGSFSITSHLAGFSPNFLNIAGTRNPAPKKEKRTTISEEKRKIGKK